MTIAAVSSTIQTYLLSIGVTGLEAVAMGDIIATLMAIYGMTAVTPYAWVGNQGGLDSNIILMLNNIARYIEDVARGVFPVYATYNSTTNVWTTAVTEAQVAAWITVNRTDIPANLAAGIADILSSDYYVTASTYTGMTGAQGFVPTFSGQPTSDSKQGNPGWGPPADVFARAVGQSIAKMIRYMRHYAAPTPDTSTNSSSYGGTAVPQLPETLY